jgi:hypothetical protein
MLSNDRTTRRDLVIMSLMTLAFGMAVVIRGLVGGS